MSELIHVQHTNPNLHDRNAVVAEERLDELEAIEREVRAVPRPRDRRNITLRFRWENGDRGLLHAPEIATITRLGDPRRLAGGKG